MPGIAGRDFRSFRGLSFLTVHKFVTSLGLKVKFLHEHELRPGCRICVQEVWGRRIAMLLRDMLHPNNVDESHPVEAPVLSPLAPWQADFDEHEREQKLSKEELQDLRNWTTLLP